MWCEEGGGVRVAIITGVYGAYDPVRSLPDLHGFDDAVCVTDDERLAPDGWRVVVKRTPMPPRMACKYPKMLPWEFTDCEAAIWLDAAFSVNGSGLSEFVRPQLERHDFIVFKHPEDRSCLVDEMRLCSQWKKYSAYPMHEQVKFYLKQGMPTGFGLWAAGMVGWRFTDEAKQFGRAWFGQNASWSIQDQVSLPYLLWKHERVPGEWECHEFDNPFITHHGHLSHH